MTISIVIKDLKSEKYFSGNIWDSTIDSWTKDIENALIYSSQQSARAFISTAESDEMIDVFDNKFLEVIPIIIFDPITH